MSLVISTEKIDTTTLPDTPNRKLGKLEVKGHMNQLVFRDYIKTTADVPEVFNFWGKRKPFPYYDTGNSDMGNCTRASQALLAQHMERLEQRKTIQISRDEIVRVYVEMSDRLYGGGDNGAYEIDALNCWRNADYTFRDYKNRPVTIQAYARINHFNIAEVKKALFLSGAKGIKVCFDLPIAWAWVTNHVWDIPDGQRATGQYQVGSWGGHSCMAKAVYTKEGLFIPSTWNEPDYFMTWRAFATYASEAYLVVDDVNVWKKRVDNKVLNLKALVSDVNNISDVKINVVA